MVVKKLARARKVWIVMLRILRREGGAPRVFILFFKALDQALLLFGAKTWVVNVRMGKALDFFRPIWQDI